MADQIMIAPPYVNLFYPNGSLNGIVIHEIGKGVPKSLFDSKANTRNLMLLLITSKHPIQIYNGLRRVLTKTNSDSGIAAIHILIPSAATKCHTFYTTALHFLAWKLASAIFGKNIQAYGFVGDLMNPQQICPFTKAFFRYYSVFHSSGSFVVIRSVIGRFCASILGCWPWAGPLLIAYSDRLSPDQRRCPDSNFGRLEHAHAFTMDNTKYIRITDNRKIWFLFSPNAEVPHAVVKQGKKEDLYGEYLMHRRAYDLLPDYVPRIGTCHNNGKEIIFCMEYVEERTIGNSVSKCRFKRKRRFYQGAAHLFDFLVKFIGDIVNMAPRTFLPAEEYDIGYIERNLGSLVSVSSESFHLIVDCLHNIRGFDLPLIPQHGDFSVGNIHYVDDVSLKLIDWEAFEEGCLPLTDFAMLTFSLESLGNSIFGISKGSLHQQEEFRGLVNSAEQQLQRLLNLDDLQFKLTSILSTAYLCARNFDRISPNPSRQLYEYLERQVSDLSTAEKA